MYRFTIYTVNYVVSWFHEIEQNKKYLKADLREEVSWLHKWTVLLQSYQLVLLF